METQDEEAIKILAKSYLAGDLSLQGFRSALLLLTRQPSGKPPRSTELLPVKEKRVHPSWGLQPRIATAVELWLAGNSYTHISQTMGITIGSVGGTLSKARAVTKSKNFFELAERVVKPRP